MSRFILNVLALLALASGTALAQSAAQKEKADSAKEALSARDFDKAARLYSELVRELPTVVGLKMNLGMACYGAGSLEEAVKYLTQAVQADPGLSQAWFFLAAAQLEIGRPREAAAAAQRYLKDKSGDLRGLQILGDSLLRSERYIRSREIFEQIVRKTPDSARAWYGLGKSYEGLAGTAFAELEKAAPESGYWFALIADSRVAQKQYFSAYYFYRKALEKQPKLRGIHVAISRIYRQTGHPEWAEKEENKEMELGEPECGQESLVCDFLHGHYQSVFEQALKQNSAEGYYWQAQACNMLAIEALSKLAALPPSLESYELRAEIDRNQGRHSESVKEWLKALELSPDDPRLKRQLALSLYLKRDYDAAQPIIDELLKKDPSSGDLNYMAGDILLYQQNAAKAVPLLERSVKSSPDLVGAQSALGRAYMALGEASKAIPHLKAALSSDEDGSLHFQLSQAYRRTSQDQLAREAFDKYQEIAKSKRDEEKKLLDEVRITPP